MAVESRLYVYAIAEAGAPARMRVLGRSLRALGAGGVSLIVERSQDDYEISEESLRRQHAIVEALADRLDPMLPVRFGTVGTAADLQARTAVSAAPLRAALELVRGRAQMTVRIQLPAASPHPIVSESAAGLSGTDYLERRRGEQASLRAVSRAVAAAAGPLIVDERVDLGRAPTRGTIFHLILKGDVAAYRRAVESCAGSLEPATLVISGPFAPYAFAPHL